MGAPPDDDYDGTYRIVWWLMIDHSIIYAVDWWIDDDTGNPI